MPDHENARDEAFLRARLQLAQLREKYLPDLDGREHAAAALLSRLLGACREAKLAVGEERGVHKIGLWHPSEVHVLLRAAGGNILIGQGPSEHTIGGLEFDPVRQVFTAENTDPLDVVTAAVARALDAKAAEAQARRPPRDGDEEDDFQELTSR